MVGWSTLVGYLTWIKPTLFKYKLDGHINTLTTHGFFAGVTLATKKIYYQETCQGRDKLIARQKTQMLSGKKRPRTGPQNQLPSASAKSTPQKQTFSYWRTYIKEFPKSVPAAVTGSFVQVLSQQRIMDCSGSTIACFVIASILLKLATQAIIKHYIIKKRIRSIRIMCAAVALPTVLIDTQTRIILLGTQSARFFTLGTLALALVEILLRSGRAYHVMRTIHNRELNIPSRRESTSTTLQQGSTKRLGSNSPSPACLEFELWRCRFQAYHVAEISADTYAEYIAMGCSASILVFFGDHPHYSLLRKLDTSGDPDSKRSIQLKMLAFQIAVEVVVDFVATALELTVGIEFGPSKSLGSFLTVFLAAIAVLNIIISIGIYLF
ncbi:hypothetical protein ON010_g5717 [Phytophthora cinnamomi]|nr:hypothetical protein ON010_g5717 [Phytophthora cinnamomi]